MQQFKSEIRQSTIQDLLQKVQKNNYEKYIKNLRLKPVRGFNNEPISFDFPVTAIIGPNGGGKTTVLGAAGCAYKDIKPSRFFAKSGVYDQSMQDWVIEFELIDKKIRSNELIRRSANFKKQKWSRESVLSRSSAVFGVSRTVPATERIELKKCANNSFEVESTRVATLNQHICDAVEKILGKNIRDYSLIQVDNKGKVTLLTGKTESGSQFSEFHFGAGESSIIRMVAQIESLNDNSLVLIEEIENGLHPLATIRVVEYLIEVAERKKIQAIFTTHSNEALLPLPNEGIWSAINQKLVQGRLDIHSLRAITGQINASLAVFVEDLFAEKWLESIIVNSGNDKEEIEVHGMEGDGTAVKIHTNHNSDPSVKFPSICYIDGDSKQKEDEPKMIFRLPGQSPENYIYNAIIDKIDEVLGELTVSLHKKFEDQSFVKEKILEIRRTNRDPHLLFIQLGKAIGFISEEVVRSAFLTIWNRFYDHDSKEIAHKIAQFKIHPTTASLPIAR